jgi:DNA-binding Xre family transcriptional regulator
MIQINLHKVAKARSIVNLHKFLRGLGFSPKLATYWAVGKPKRVDLEHLETVCKRLNCEPYDIMEWTPDENDKAYLDTHPLKKLLPKPDVTDVRYILRTLPKEELDAVLNDIRSRHERLHPHMKNTQGEFWDDKRKTRKK